MSGWLKSIVKGGGGAAASDISSEASKTGLQSLHTDLLTTPPIVKVNLPLPMLRPARVSNDAASSPLAFYLDNVFTPLECREMIRLTEAIGYGAALINVGGGRQTLISDVRDSTRCMVDDSVVAQRIFERIAAYLPQQWDMPPSYSKEQTPQEAKLVSLNERLRFLRYTKGQKFLPHYDGSYCRPRTEKDPFPEQSFVTVQLYLNDGEGSEHPDFGGGSTAFLLNNDYVINSPSAAAVASHRDSDPASIPESLLVHCHPRAGRVLVFQHNLLHQGSPVTSGVKYCLRTDAMFKPDSKLNEAKSSQQPSSDCKPPADYNAIMRD